MPRPVDPAELRIGIKVGPQEGMSYARFVALAQAAEIAGFEAFFRSDHWQSTASREEPGVTDAWTSLAGVARETSRIRLGTLVSPVAFRGPYQMAKVAATVDEMSDGRVELGLGAGWHEPEHTPIGLSFGTYPERFDQLEEQLAIIRGLWTGEPLTFAGRHYRLEAAVSRPRPVQASGPTLILGGSGKPRGLRLAARYADEYNVDTASPEVCAEVAPRLDVAMAAAGRPPGSLRYSVMMRPPNGVEALRERLTAFGAAGIDRVVLDIGADPPPELLARLAADVEAAIGRAPADLPRA